MIYTVLLIIIAVIAYGIGSMSSVVIASNFVFHVNLRQIKITKDQVQMYIYYLV